MKIVQYCQHVLGIGHLFRSLEIARALDAHEILLVTGGPRVDVPLPSHVQNIHLAGLEMDSTFSSLNTSDGQEIETVKQARSQKLFQIMHEEQPDIFLVELYPFGRKKFRFELDPVLDAIKDGRIQNTKVVCSLRDILVERSDKKKFEQRVIKTLNKSFDALLIHSDPLLQPLDQTFSRVDDIAIPIHYTGFVASRPEKNAREVVRKRFGVHENKKLIIASAGGGKVGGPLLHACARSAAYLDEQSTDVRIYTGPFLDQNDFDELQNLASELPHVQINRFANNFIDILAAADISVSMAGYNTTMNLVAANVKSLVLPFDVNNEQISRATHLAQDGIFQILNQKDLAPRVLAERITTMLNSDNEPSYSLDISGAQKTAELLRSI